ncbi:DUF523 domain-containing protein [Methanolobus mangrovi]|uniref:DUF523 domain-containing protein n=1 Tax=Methanolobus mangrovi TaxID=3072977 RepID=A0AA51UHL1_9EURY|nr:DUF523 domain-containing protein [Methanolobus mangrovi]WMW23123.1 DUF523 domain-containing protein [Methanolobus mangrovi]
MRKFPRPTVLVSKCLEFDNVRYNAQIVHSQIVRDLMPFVDFIKVCPEIEIGLGVPRDSLRLIKKNGEYRLIQPKTGEDLTERMNTFTCNFLDKLGDIDGFIFKGISPSMGVDDVKVYAGAYMAPVVERSAGLFARQVIARYPGYPIEENERLRNSRISHHFLTQLYTFAAFRQVKAEYSLDALLEFHKNNRFLFMTYNTEILIGMSELLGSGKETGSLFGEYESLLKQLMRKPGSLILKIETARNMFSMFADTTQAENSFFEDMLGRFKNNWISEDAVIEVLRMFSSRFYGVDSYEDTFLYPYPEEIKGQVDESRDKDYWDK